MRVVLRLAAGFGLAMSSLGGGGTGGSEVRTSRMAERARLGEGMERLSGVGCVAPGGVGLSSGAEGRRVGRGKALDQRR